MRRASRREGERVAMGGGGEERGERERGREGEGEGAEATAGPPRCEEGEGEGEEREREREQERPAVPFPAFFKRLPRLFRAFCCTESGHVAGRFVEAARESAKIAAELQQDAGTTPRYGLSWY
eukprot:3354004-Rhodomonas_salina.1